MTIDDYESSLSPSVENFDVVIIGGGAAGLMAAAAAGARGKRTIVLEKNKKIGVKILMSGGTRCNITHDCSPREIADQFGHAAKFLYKAIGQLPPQEVVQIVEGEGVLTKIESTGKVFPVSDHAIDVRDALLRRAKSNGAHFLSGVAVKSIERQDGNFVCHSDAGVFTAPSLIICCGGKSYAGCGTTGDGYGWAKQFGHTVRPPHPALTPLTTDEQWVKDLSGITLERVRCEILRVGESKPLASRVGSLLFTHTGLSGPEPMNLSRYVTSMEAEPAKRFRIDFSPDTSADAFVQHARELARTHPKSTIAAALLAELPSRLIEVLFDRCQIPAGQKLADFSTAQLMRLRDAVKGTEIQISGTRGFDKAEVTAGGVELSEVNPATMESRLVPRLFFAGEILNVDGPIGGFNFQAAFSTGTLAGKYA
ncbi:MAG: NAD(P)/FAD-dependent oxidoreductase [Pirellulaceae bacterium]